jgi:hypothetical protein
MRGTFDIHPDGQEFEAKVATHVVGLPFSTLTISIGDFRLNLYGAADDALKLIRVSTLLNEIFASEKVEAE